MTVVLPHGMPLCLWLYANFKREFSDGKHIYLARLKQAVIQTEAGDVHPACFKLLTHRNDTFYTVFLTDDVGFVTELQNFVTLLHNIKHAKMTEVKLNTHLRFKLYSKVMKTYTYQNVSTQKQELSS